MIFIGLNNLLNIYSYKEAIDSSNTIIQSLALLFGGFWAYKKFYIERNLDRIVELKLILLGYDNFHRQCAGSYQLEKTKNDEAILAYQLKMINKYNSILPKVLVSNFLPKKLKKEIQDTIFMPLKRYDSQPEERWKEFCEKLKKVQNKLDNIIDS